MNDDLKALRALVEAAAEPDCLYCDARGDDKHERDCPVPAAEAALARLEASFAFEPTGPMIAALRKQERIGYDKAREQAARFIESGGVGCRRAEHVQGSCDCEDNARRIRAMEPEP